MSPCGDGDFIIDNSDGYQGPFGESNIEKAFFIWSDPKGGNMAEHPEEKPNSEGLFALCAGTLIGVVSGIFIGWIIWG